MLKIVLDFCHTNGMRTECFERFNTGFYFHKFTESLLASVRNRSGEIFGCFVNISFQVCRYPTLMKSKIQCKK